MSAGDLQRFVPPGLTLETYDGTAWISVTPLTITGLRPTGHAYGATVYILLGYQGFHVAVLLLMGCYTLARSLFGLLDSQRRATFDNTMLLWHYMVGQGLVALAVIHLFPRLVG